MKQVAPIGVGCSIAEDGTVLPSPGFRGRFTSDGRYSGRCRFRLVPGGTPTEPDLIIASRATEAEAEEEAETELYDFRFVTLYWLKEERNITTATVTYGSTNEPVVGVHGYPSGALTGVIFNAAFPGFGPDPALVASTGGPIGWPILSYEGAPFYPSGGFWVEGFDPPSYPVGVPWTLNMSVGALDTATFVDGFGETWEWDFKPIGVREYKLAAMSWPENYGY